MSILQEFKTFAMRGNVVDLAIGVIMGAAFGRIVSSLVGDMLMPPIGKLMGNVNFRDLYVSLDHSKTAGIHSLAKAKETGAAVIAYGSFLQTVIDFFIVALCIFLLVKAINAMKLVPPAEATEKECPYCLSKIPLRATKCAHCTSVLPT
jgi:large conductance mechanosensitive channel